ncbi:MAG: Gar1/Naf1 family protein [Methanobacteriaceae archaeon]|jgi:RNA-binding protein|nr:Gar1/Naf1 family protein [Methanobacteriaceae archaeon]
MKFLGNSLHIANSGKLIVKSSFVPLSGAFVFNSKKKKIGKINNVFGPTRNPYISINIFKSSNYDEIKRNYGEKIFVSKTNKKSKKRGNKPRRKR